MSTETRFPPGFVWGVATSAYQVEGAVREGGRGPSIWDTFSRVPGRVVGGDTGDVAADHYHRYREDAALMADLGVRAYRFSVAWPRVQPRGRGPANPEGLDFYRRLVDGLLEQGIEPWVTLYHWDLPQALQDAGGWANREVAGRFVEYAAVVYEALRDRVVNWTTLNEPWCAAFLGHAAGVHAPGLQDPATALRATHHLLLAHGQAVRALRSLAGGPRLGINLNLDPVIPASAEPADLEAARRIDGRYNRLFLDPLLFGRYPDDVLEELDGLGGLDRVDPGELETIAVPLDLLGVNYYRPFTVAARPQRPRFGGPPSPWVGAGDVEFVARGLPRTALGWEIDASGLDEVLLRLHRDYPRIPLFVTENGAAFEDGVDAQGRVRDDARVRFLDEHLRAAHRAIAGGVDLRGFFVWSLLDNFEWAEGYSKRFGIVYVDFPTQRRVAKDSARWYQDAIARGGLDGRPPGPAEDASGVRAAGRTPPADPAGNPPRAPNPRRVTVSGGPGGAPTLEQVAALAGVSRATVSRVVNGSPRVSVGVRAQVERAVAKLGYVPNRAARSLVTRRADSIALAVSEPQARFFSEPFFAGMVRGISAALAQTDVQLVLLIAQDLPDRGRLERYVTGGHVDGVLLVSLHGDDPLPRTLERAGVPAVISGRPAGASPVSYVDADNRGGAREAVAHLVRRGRRRIAIVAGPLDMVAGMDRLDGYRDGLLAAGLPQPAGLVEVGDFGEESGAAATRRLLDRAPDLDAVFAASDLMAAGALRALKAAGRRVPEDVAVIGFDDSAIARYAEPPLTTVRQPVEEMGRQMTRLLLAKVAGEAAGMSVILQTELVVRASA